MQILEQKARVYDQVLPVDDYQIQTDSGWQDIKNVKRTPLDTNWKVVCLNIDGKEIEINCADNHILYLSNGDEIFAKNLNAAHIVQHENGPLPVIRVENTLIKVHMYDVEVDSFDHRYYANGFLSHNSIFLANAATNLSLGGANVFLASLEMKSEKLIKRAGSNVFGVKMYEYDEFSSNVEQVATKLKQWHDRRRNLEEHLPPAGRFMVQRFANASPITIFAAMYRIGMKYNIKWDALVLDYAGELESDDGYGLDKMYALHKINNARLYSESIKSDIATITAYQLGGQFYNIDDYSLDAVGESRGLTHRTDNIFGIIQTETMHSDLTYYLKYLKLRDPDSNFKNHRSKLKIDYDYMRLGDTGEILDPEALAI